MANQNSIISYVPQPFFESGSASIANVSNVSAFENSAGIFDPDLSNFTTVVPTASASDFSFQITFPKQSAHLASANVTVALIGCSMLTYENDGGEPDLATEFSENIVCLLTNDIGTVTSELVSYAHNSQDNVHTFESLALPSIISGGRTNLVVNGLGAASAGATGTVTAKFKRKSADVSARPHVRLRVGHLFVGIDIPVWVDPRSFAWTMFLENQRFKARDFGAINSDGTLVRRATGEIIRFGHEIIVGSQVASVGPIVDSVVPNLFDLVKSNCSYPLLFNPYPRSNVTEAALTVDEANYTARQNFFSIYGFMDDPLEINVGEFREGLNSEYRARFRIEETR
jgi:hypothetical protein